MNQSPPFLHTVHSFLPTLHFNGPNGSRADGIPHTAGSPGPVPWVGILARSPPTQSWPVLSFSIKNTPSQSTLTLTPTRFRCLFYLCIVCLNAQVCQIARHTSKEPFQQHSKVCRLRLINAHGVSITSHCRSRYSNTNLGHY